MNKAVRAALIAVLIIGVFSRQGFSVLRAGRDKIMRKDGKYEKELKLIPIHEKIKQALYKRFTLNHRKLTKNEQGKGEMKI